MPSTRRDPDGDFSYVPRLLDPDAPVVRPKRPETPRKPLTSAQKNFRARRIEEEHAHIKEKGSFPDADALAAMTPEQREASLAHTKAIKAAHTIIEETGVENPAGEQLTFDDVDPDELDPGRPF